MLPHLYIHSAEFTTRFEWLIHVFFGQWFQIPHEYVSDTNVIPEDAIVLSYGEQLGLENELFIPAHHEGCVLHQNLLRSPETAEGEGEIQLFPVEGGDMPLDIFSAAAFCLGRMEEYNRTDLDEHDRFPGNRSHAFKQGYLHRAIVDRYFDQLCTQLIQYCDDWSICVVQMRSYQPTIDVDSVWAFRNKSLVRQIGGLLRDLMTARFRNIGRRIQTYFGTKKDPFDTFEHLRELHASCSVEALYFILSSNSSRFDPQVDVHSRDFKQWITDLAQYADVGLHPSYSSMTSAEKIKQEKEILEASIEQVVSLNRFHYLRFHLPGAYRRLVAVGIRADFSMGYADRCGFRAGTARPYNWYDMEREEETELMVYPFQVMDTTLNKYLNYSPDEALELMKKLYIECRKTGGTFRTLWHNSSLSGMNEWSGWSDLYSRWISEYRQ